MNPLAGAAMLGWLVVCGLSLLAWVPPRRAAWSAATQALALAAVLALVGGGTVAVAGLAATADPLAGRGDWLAAAVGAAATALTGGAVATAVLGLVDTSGRAGRAAGTGRVQRLMLRGGAWIGVLERLGLFGTLLAGWPEGVAAIIAVKGLARYPELQVAPTSGTTERFIIGTFASLGWAAVCAGVTVLLV